MGCWLLCWQMLLGGGWWIALGVLLLFPQKTWVKVLYPLLGLLLIPLCLLRYSQGVDRMMEKLEGGPEALGLHDRLALYGLNGMMGLAGGLLGAPEASVETLLLMVPSSGERAWESQRFPLCAPKVAAAVARQQEQAQAGDQSFAPRNVQWALSEQGRGGLALNPMLLQTTRSGSQLHVRGIVQVDYVADYSLPILKLGPMNIRVEQGLFHALEELGWLHPYALSYESILGVEEDLPRSCEAWSVRLVRGLALD